MLSALPFAHGILGLVFLQLGLHGRGQVQADTVGQHHERNGDIGDFVSERWAIERFCFGNTTVLLPDPNSTG